MEILPRADQFWSTYDPQREGETPKLVLVESMLQKLPPGAEPLLAQAITIQLKIHSNQGDSTALQEELEKLDKQFREICHDQLGVLDILRAEPKII